MQYEAVIGLEIHAQLQTESKIFCGCSTKFGAAPNSQTCPVCWGMPGVLPVLNRRVVEFAIKMGLAINCAVRRRSIFARKNYFYPDLPKNYQISQYEEPLAEHGWVEIEVNGETKHVGITRIHLEEDAGKLIHSAGGRSFVDFNRCGVPLIEIVSEPDMRTPAEAAAYLKALRDILVYLDICDGNMEEGSFRCDANVSVRPIGQKEFGTKAELKNMNSFRFVEKAIAYEIGRQIDVIKSGGKVIQETRLFDSEKGVTHSMRSKEEAKDYRYFPEPDLLPLIADEDWVADIRNTLPEMPEAKRARFISQYGLPSYDAGVLTAEKPVAEFFEQAVKIHDNPKSISNWIMGELLHELKIAECTLDRCKIAPASLAELVKMIDEGVITGKIAKSVFEEMWTSGKMPAEIVEEKHLKPISDLDTFVGEVIKSNPKQVQQYLKGKETMIGFFIGQVMKMTKGKADPKELNRIVKEKLDALK